ncbi:hypothetical protein [Cupriavidus sp. D384]|uniref:hypothetical protein n=1 Tax=Cupriavidus sp. D384 TaxID=1538095 RepID=UPI00082AE763|nr:hypothetical protein [Cupriavidus sp. D384]
MTLDLALDDGHDLDLSHNGDCWLVDGAGRIGQQIRVTLRALLGEWFLDTTFGVPYFEAVLVKNPNRAALEAIFRARIADVPGVRTVRRIDFRIDRERRSLEVDFAADTDHGLVARREFLRA